MIERCDIRRTAVTVVGGVSSSGEGSDVSADHYFAHAMNVVVGNVEVALGVDRQALRTGDLRGGGGDAVAVVSAGAGARHGEDGRAGRRHLAHAVIVLIRNVEESVAVKGQAYRATQLGVDRRNAVAVVSRRAGARERRDGSAGRNFAHHVVAAIGDV